jgi:hypothetical protein
MKRIAIALALSFVALAPPVVAQESSLNHGQIGVYADYFRLRGPASATFWGLGARISGNVHQYVQIEGEMNYDFARSFSEGFTNPVSGSVTFAPSDLRILHGLFGPKFQAASGAVRPFVVAKGGFINFRFDDRPVTFGTFFSSTEDLRSSDMSGVFYPGGGVEFYLGPVGVRFEAGDEIYYTGKPHHNLRMVLGPTIRF